MTKDQALDLFGELEKMRHPDSEEPLAPVYAVRLDASHNRDDDTRDFRLRVAPGPYGVETNHWREVILLADEAGLDVTVENSGIELR